MATPFDQAMGVAASTMGQVAKRPKRPPSPWAKPPAAVINALRTPAPQSRWSGMGNAVAQVGQAMTGGGGYTRPPGNPSDWKGTIPTPIGVNSKGGPQYASVQDQNAASQYQRFLNGQVGQGNDNPQSPQSRWSGMGDAVGQVGQAMTGGGQMPRAPYEGASYEQRLRDLAARQPTLPPDPYAGMTPPNAPDSMGRTASAADLWRQQQGQQAARQSSPWESNAMQQWLQQQAARRGMAQAMGSGLAQIPGAIAPGYGG